MARRYLVVSYIVLQGLSVVAMEKTAGSNEELRNSKESLRSSTDSLSKSREFKQSTARAMATGAYVDSPCGNWMRLGQRAVSCLKPLPPLSEGEFYP